MKRISVFFAIMLLTILICPGVARAAGEMQLVIEPSKTEVAVGETVEFIVKLTNVDGVVTNMQFSLDIPEGMEYISGKVVEGNGFKGLEAFNPNKNYQYAMAMNDMENSGDVEVLKFTCKASGSGKVTIGVVEDDTFKVEEDGERFEVTIAAAKVNITAVSGSTGNEDTNAGDSNTNNGSDDGNSDDESASAADEISIDNNLEDTGESVKLEDAIKEQESKKAKDSDKVKEIGEEEAEDNTVFWIVIGIIAVLCVIVIVLIFKKLPRKEKKNENTQD